MATTERAYEELVRRMAAELNADNVDALDEILASDYVIHRVNDPEERDREEYKELLRDNREGAEHVTQTVEDVHLDVDADEILERTQLRWREGDVTLNVNRLHHVEDGRIAETWELHVPTDTPGVGRSDRGGTEGARRVRRQDRVDGSEVRLERLLPPHW